MSAAAKPRDWDAATYHRVSDLQLGWGLEVLDRLQLQGDERVLDAGCGTGRVTSHLLERLPRGRVVAVDGSPSMVEKAHETLGTQRVEIFEADLAELTLPEPVDAVFSTAVFHWIPDHQRLFRRLHDALKPGGMLVAQCGGTGNVARLKDAIEEVSASERFARHFSDWTSPYNFQDPESTQGRLRTAGFAEAQCWLEPKTVAPDDKHGFLKAVSLGPHLGHLPDTEQDDFVDAVAERMPDPLELEYVRLNIDARRT